jgi:hypothetical protein
MGLFARKIGADDAIALGFGSMSFCGVAYGPGGSDDDLPSLSPRPTTALTPERSEGSLMETQPRRERLLAAAGCSPCRTTNPRLIRNLLSVPGKLGTYLYRRRPQPHSFAVSFGKALCELES